MALANGRIPTATLTPIPARYYSHGAGAFLRSDAAASFLRLAAAFEARFGKPLVCISFYRTLERQIEIFRERYTPRPSSVTRKQVASDRVWQGRVWRLAPGRAPSATPGLSNHGLGQAVDFHAGVQTAGSAEHKWFQANAPAYGWDFAEGRRNGEPWHWTYSAATDRHKLDSAVKAATSGAASATATHTAAKATNTAAKAAQEDDVALTKDQDRALAAIYSKMGRFEQILEALDVRTGNMAKGRLAQAAEAILGRHAQILEAVDVRTGNSQTGRLAMAADRTLGVLPAQRKQLVDEIAAEVVKRLKAQG